MAIACHAYPELEAAAAAELERRLRKLGLSLPHELVHAVTNASPGRARPFSLAILIRWNW
ncbi:hypothetical protein MHAS_00077 [Mycolicibacterium hassiacum DSM 44199]|nr:hypothetical protein MHAS_00077 [Mycolicibacterium hassiacum DSM 44199]